jgi:hypothetical protein
VGAKVSDTVNCSDTQQMLDPVKKPDALKTLDAVNSPDAASADVGPKLADCPK